MRIGWELFSIYESNKNGEILKAPDTEAFLRGNSDDAIFMFYLYFSLVLLLARFGFFSY